MSTTSRRYSLLDTLLMGVDNALRALTPQNQAARRPYPAKDTPEPTLSPQERQRIAGFMRVNHAGEVCAQALYHGQASTARLADIREKMQHAAIEELDHLAWCERRLEELGDRPSILNPAWYLGAFMIGATAGLIGDAVSLGFVAETEAQVIRHLESHLKDLPPQDQKTAQVLEQMRIEETAHGEMAKTAGAADFPYAIKILMHCVSKIMTKTAFYI